MWNLVLVNLDTMLVSVQEGARFAPNVPLALKSFWMDPMVLLAEVGYVESHFGLFKDIVSVSAI
jgi:hypothetical protein